MEGIWRDMCFALRSWSSNRRFAMAVVCAVALGIGLTTAIFTMVSAVLLRPLPYQDADRLVMVWETKPTTGTRRFSVSLGDYGDWKGQETILEEMAAIEFWGTDLRVGDLLEQVESYRVSSNFFHLLGVTPALGRDFSPDDERPGSPPVALLSHDCWVTRFGADPNVMGKSITAGNEVYAVIGVLPTGFRATLQSSPMHPQIWLPLTPAAGQLQPHGPGTLRVIARLSKDVTIAQAQTAMNAIAGRLVIQYPKSNAGIGAVVYPLKDEVVRLSRTSLLILPGAAGFVMLIACADVANLMLAATIEREREIGIRLALGATRLHIARQMLTEGGLLSFAGGTLGFFLAYFLFEVKATDPLTIAIACGLLLAVALLSSYIPARRASSVDPVVALRSE